MAMVNLDGDRRWGPTCQGAWNSSLPGAHLAPNTHPTINKKLRAGKPDCLSQVLQGPRPAYIDRRLSAPAQFSRRWPAPPCLV